MDESNKYRTSPPRVSVPVPCDTTSQRWFNLRPQRDRYHVFNLHHIHKHPLLLNLKYFVVQRFCSAQRMI